MMRDYIQMDRVMSPTQKKNMVVKPMKRRGPESSQSWPKIKIAECDFLYFFRSLGKENILKYMIISIFNFSKEFKAVIKTLNMFK